MTTIQAFFLAIVQGVTEFLPVSSSGHLVIFQKLFNLGPTVFFDVLVHVGTLGAIFYFFRYRLGKIFKGAKNQGKKSSQLIKQIAIGTIPIVLLGFFIKPQINQIFSSLRLVSLGYVLTAIVLLSLILVKKRTHFNQLNWKSAVVIGVFQALALFPGVSRSGLTISAGLWQGLKKEEAFEFSFLLSIPAISGALILESSKIINNAKIVFLPSVLGMFVAGIVGFVCLKLLKKTLLGTKIWLFGVYCLGLSFLLFVLN
jgi:undecaprenyl-diphosphatase